MTGRSPASFAARTGAGLKLRAVAPDAVPRLSDRHATLAVALTTLIMAYAGHFGFLSILVFYAMWLPRLRFRGQWMIRPTRDVVTVLMFPVFACLSFLWSAHPQISLYNALEYTSSILCAVIMARIVSTPAFMRGIIIGAAVVLAASLASGKYGVDPFSGNYALVGLFGSKNIVGQFSEVGIIFCLIHSLRRQSVMSRLALNIAPLLLFAVTLYQSKSASSVLSLIIVLGLLAVLFVITRLPRVYRGFAFTLFSVWLLVIVVTGATLNWQETVLQSFGKSTTLTGRTLLWQKGIETGMEHPLLGIGYGAFWVHGNLPAEHLWYKFGISNRAGFHFHSIFIQVFAEMGVTGLAMMLWLLIQNISRSFFPILRYGMVPDYLLCFSLAVMFTIRAFVEVDVIGTFSIGPVLFYSILPRLATLHRERQLAAQAAS